ncbi:MAG: DMT family transporter [Clostridiales bacterium]|nr:DMT family transporter [Clostridiales bacterium]
MKHNQVRQVVFPVLAALIWGTAFVAQSISTKYVEPMTFNATRSLIAFVVLFLGLQIYRFFQKKRHNLTLEVEKTPMEKKQAKKDLLLGGFFCGTALAVGANLQQAGIADTSAGKAGFITALYIVIVPVLGLFLKKKVPFSVWISVVIAVGGLYCLCVKENFTIAPSDSLVLLCAIVFSIHILVIDYYTQRVDGVALSCVQFLVAAIWSAIGMLIFEHPSFSAIMQCIWPILYVGVFSSGVGYTLQILAQKDSNPTVVSLLLSLESVFATLAGAILLHEQMSGKEYLGCVMMLVAVVLAQIPMPLKKKTVSVDASKQTEEQ